MIGKFMKRSAALALSFSAMTGAANASVLTAQGVLDPCAEVLSPPNGAGTGPACTGTPPNILDPLGNPPSPHSGTFAFTYDTVTKLLTIAFEYTGLSDDFTTWHIHGPADENHVAGAMLEGPVIFPLADEDGTSSFSDENPFHASVTLSDTLLGAFGHTLAGFEAALHDDLLYLNIHSALPDGFPLGELRGQLFFVPEPTSMGLLGAGLAGLGYFGRRRKA